MSLTRAHLTLSATAGVVLLFLAGRMAQPDAAACNLGNPSGTLPTLLLLAAAVVADVTAYLAISNVRRSENQWFWTVIGAAAVLSVPFLLFAANLSAHPCGTF